MKTSTLVLLVAAFAEIKPSGANSVRGLHRGKAGPFRGGFIDDKCDALQCPDDPSELDCTFEEPIRKENWSELSEEDRAAKKEEIKARRERLALCACCTDSSIEDLLPEREDGPRPFKGGHKGRKRKFMTKMLFGEAVEDKCDTLTCPADVSSLDCSFERPERPDVDWFDLSLDEKTTLKEGAESRRGELRERLAMCVCCTDSTVEDLLPGRLERLEGKIEERCDGEVECPADPSALDCSFERPERGDWSPSSRDEWADMKAEKKASFQERRERMKMCVCCTDATLGELLPTSSSEDGEGSSSEDGFGGFFGPDEDEEVEVAVLLSQANSQEGSVETQEAASSAGLAVVSFSSAAALLAVAAAMM